MNNKGILKNNKIFSTQTFITAISLLIAMILLLFEDSLPYAIVVGYGFCIGIVLLGFGIYKKDTISITLSVLHILPFLYPILLIIGFSIFGFAP